MEAIPQTGVLYTLLHLRLQERGMMYVRRRVTGHHGVSAFAEMKYRTSIYYLLAAAHEDMLSPLTIAVYMRRHNLSPQMDASVWVRGRARQG